MITFDLDVLREAVGPTAAREFEQADDVYKADLYVWATETLPGYDDRTFIQRASAAIYDGANVSRFRGNYDHVHFKGSASYTESARRHALAHPDKDCNATTLYEKAWNHSVRDAGHSHMANDLRPCTCSNPTDSPVEA